MADAPEEITYTPEELEEINRIVSFISSTDTPVQSEEEDIPQEEPVSIEDDFAPEAVSGIDETYEGEPEDLDLPSFNIDDDTPEALNVPEEEEVEPAPFEEALPDGVEDISDFLTEAEEITEENADPDEVSLDEISDGEDISEYIESTEEPAGVDEPASEIQPIDDEVSLDDLTPLEDIADLPEAEPVSDFDEAPAASTPLDELDALTADEPESLDAEEFSPDDVFVGGEDEAPATEIPPPVEEASDFDDLPEIDGLDDSGVMEEFESASEAPSDGDETISLGTEDEADIPDLSDLSFEEPGEMQEADDSDIPDINLDDISAEGPAADIADMSVDETPVGIDDLSGDEFSSIADDELSMTPMDEGPEIDLSINEDVSVEEMPLETSPSSPGPATIDESDIPDIEDDGGLDIELLDDEEPAPVSKPTSQPAQNDSLELSERDIKKLKKAILLFNPALIQVIKNTVINDSLPKKETAQLIDIILTGKPESNIHRFLEKKLNRRINLLDEKAVPSRKVITSRPEYTTEGRDRQKRLLKKTKIAGAAALATIILFLVGYRFVYKPIMAKNRIRDGVALIIKSGDYLRKPKDYFDAEDIFRYVDDNYIKNYIYGYTEYARAYFSKKEYARSLDKLNRIYTIQYKKGKDIDLKVFNELGYYYSRVPAEFYSSLKSHVKGWYHPTAETGTPGPTQLDLAIEFYKRTLLRDKKNVPAMYGIGNSYYYQGSYIKAKKYYENILKIDSDSVVGYSGLLNLYVSRDAFAQVVSIHADLREKTMLHKIPSALLAKLASYYLSKNKSDKINIRIDYGVLSPRFKDINDNIYPAVRSVLTALNKRDPDYPPLHLQYARLSMLQKNYMVMKRYLDKALKLAPNYYGALHMLGEYYYFIKEPVSAYETLNRAIKAYGNQPEFARDDFYQETEKIGHTYALLGNIFYYFFDKVKARYGDLEDEIIKDDMDTYANLSIARDKYEKALSERYESSEVHYNLGRIFYLSKLYKKALDQWLNLYEDFVNHPELMFALGNAFYHLGNNEAAKGQYLKIISYYEFEADKIHKAILGDVRQIKIFQSLASSYNNIGAIYQLQQNEGKSDISYWKAIDFAKRIDRENEFARVNLARSFKRSGKTGEPILDENIPYSIDIYRKEMRK